MLMVDAVNNILWRKMGRLCPQPKWNKLNWKVGNANEPTNDRTNKRVCSRFELVSSYSVQWPLYKYFYFASFLFMSFWWVCIWCVCVCIICCCPLQMLSSLSRAFLVVIPRKFYICRQRINILNGGSRGLKYFLLYILECVFAYMHVHIELSEGVHVREQASAHYSSVRMLERANERDKYPYDG